ncbi:Cro/CI family transcriptional regulator [Acidithiobacillus sp.]|uniref:transcriptional regulator n=1 Tax=Acidithiobacillus sp. TaxID=1872118 RepID=UPI002601CFF6|nr:Cro/CI family transcriptional regulator [Acidithiobacillus sp.]MDD5279529.1 Cro/CI family transcriptional regulator [Acidithiobacillus sp.]
MNEAILKTLSMYGSQDAMAKAIGVSQFAVSKWVRGVGAVSAESAVLIEHATGGAITREDLRPDIFRKDLPSTHIATPVLSANPDPSICPRGHSE